MNVLPPGDGGESPKVPEEAVSRSLRKRWLGMALVLLIAGCAIQIFAGYSHSARSGHVWGSDDAYISYRYAQNVVAGQGLVFNPGERVEGYSNFLYLLLLIPAAAMLPAGWVYAYSVGLNVVFLIAAWRIVVGYSFRRFGDARATTLAFLIALCPPLWAAVASGLETPLCVLMQTATWILVERAAEGKSIRSAIGLVVVSALCVLVRADGFVTPLLAAVFLALRGRMMLSAGTLVATALVFGTHVLGRLAYYGWPLPNTYYAKVGSTVVARIEQGMLQVLDLASSSGLGIYIMCFAAAAIQALARFIGRREHGAELGFPVVFSAGLLGYFVYVGGDVYHERFLLSLFPMGACLALSALPSALSAALSRRLVLLGGGFLAIGQLAQLANDDRFQFSFTRGDGLIEVGEFLGSQHPGAVVAVDAAGKIPYYSRLRVIDVFGLTDSHIAHVVDTTSPGPFVVGHNKTDWAYVLEREPDLVAVWASVWPPTPARQWCHDYDLRYVVDLSPEAVHRIVDVRMTEPAELEALVQQGYDYAVFSRREEARDGTVGRRASRDLHAVGFLRNCETAQG